MKFKLFIITALFYSGYLFAQNDGAANTGLSFLKLGITSRSIALGDAVVSSSDDASATYYNPADLFLGRNVNILFMHNQQILGIKTEYLGAKIKMSKFALGFSINNTSVSDIQVRLIPGAAQDVFTAQDFAFGVSAAYKINNILQVGLTGKFLYEKIFVDNSNGYALDLGALYTNGKIAAGLCIANIGSMNVLRTQATKLPTSVRFGASYLIAFPKIGGGIRVAADGYKVLNGGLIHGNAGAEFVYKDFLSIRAGYQTGYDDKSLTTGIGLRYKAISLDYAFVPYKYSLGNSHTLTLGTSF
jgi:hypothetical protein